MDPEGDISSCHATEADAQAQADKMNGAMGGGMMQNSAAPRIERRSFQISELRIDGKEKPVITGHAAVFNQKSEEIFGFREIVKPGAFANTITKNDIRALWNHDANFVLGRNKSGTLQLSEDNQGLAVRISPPDTIWASDLIESMHRGDVDQMSFGFRTVSDNWRVENKITIRELIEVELFDVSPVTFPAYPQTDVQARSYFESRMRELSGKSGFSDEEKADFASRMRARREFLKAHATKPDPLSMAEILKRCRSKGEKHGS